MHVKTFPPLSELGLSALGREKKTQLSSQRLEPGTFQFIAQHFDHYTVSNHPQMSTFFVAVIVSVVAKLMRTVQTVSCTVGDLTCTIAAVNLFITCLCIHRW